MSEPRHPWPSPIVNRAGDGRHPRDDSLNDITIERSDTGDAPSRFRLLDVDALAGIVEPKPLIQGVLYQRGFSAIIGPYSSYKSFVALDQDLSIALGLDWHGRDVTRGTVVYQAGEGTAGLHRRVNAWRTLTGLPDVGGILFLPQSLKLNDARDLAALLEVLRQVEPPPIKLTLDTFARSLRGNENDVKDTGLYVESVDAIREIIKCHVQIVHHTGWEGTRSRGSSNLPASLDTEITLARDGDRVTLTNTKQKDAEPFAPITLEATSIANSIAFTLFAPTSARLSPNERELLREVQESGPLTTTKWLTAVDVKRRSFFAAKRRLLALAYIKETDDGWLPTEAGRQGS